MPKVSVIVPVYKAEAYLHRCVDSLLAQTFQDFEILLVDDGSPDYSGKICDEYARQDSRVRVFHKENGGVSSARNLGLDECLGEWVAFVDADDYVDENYLYIDPRFYGADVIEKSYSVIYEGEARNERRAFQDGALAKKDIYYYFVNKRNNALWNKLFSRRLIASMRFDEKTFIGEDFLFFLSILSAVNNYVFSSMGEYFYIIHRVSAMQTVVKSPLIRIRILWENMEKIKAITAENKLHFLQSGLVYGTYALTLSAYWPHLSSEERLKLRQLFSHMKYRDLRLLAWKNKLRLMMMKLRCRYKV